MVRAFEHNSPPAFAPPRDRQASPRYAGKSARAYLEACRQDKIAYGVAGVIAYDKTCEKVSPKIMNAAQEMKRTVPAEAVSAASVNCLRRLCRWESPSGVRK